ncbi:MAG: hypothetical protein PVJ64_00355 [Gemmatimonadales bacterium]|jgi:hypothetical protein
MSTMRWGPPAGGIVEWNDAFGEWQWSYSLHVVAASRRAGDVCRWASRRSPGHARGHETRVAPRYARAVQRLRPDLALERRELLEVAAGQHRAIEWAEGSLPETLAWSSEQGLSAAFDAATGHLRRQGPVDEWLAYWHASQPRPDRVGSPYNSEPRDVYWAHRRGVPVEYAGHPQAGRLAARLGVRRACRVLRAIGLGRVSQVPERQGIVSQKTARRLLSLPSHAQRRAVIGWLGLPEVGLHHWPGLRSPLWEVRRDDHEAPIAAPVGPLYASPVVDCEPIREPDAWWRDVEVTLRLAWPRIEHERDVLQDRRVPARFWLHVILGVTPALLGRLVTEGVMIACETVARWGRERCTDYRREDVEELYRGGGSCTSSDGYYTEVARTHARTRLPALLDAAQEILRRRGLDALDPRPREQRLPRRRSSGLLPRFVAIGRDLERERTRGSESFLGPSVTASASQSPRRRGSGDAITVDVGRKEDLT